MNYTINMDKFEQLVLEYLDKLDYPKNAYQLLKMDPCPFEVFKPDAPELVDGFNDICKAYITMMRQYDDNYSLVQHYFATLKASASVWTVEHCLGMMNNAIDEGLGPGVVNTSSEVIRRLIELYMDHISVNPKEN